MNRPFDETRYRELLEGLEIVELSFTQVFGATQTKRFDPEYFNRTALLAEQKLGKSLRLGDVAKEGYRVVYESTQVIEREEGTAKNLPFFLQATDITTPFIDAEAMVCVSEDDWIRYPKGRIQPGELLIEVKGKAEKIAIVPNDFPPKTLVTGTCFKLVTKHPDDRYLLTAYLTCKYGQALKERLKTNLLVSYLAKDDLYALPVPDVSVELRKILRACFERCFMLHNDAMAQIKRAEQALLRALGLENWQPPEPLAYTRSSRDAFAAGRLDAEHYQPKYSQIEALIIGTGQAERLRNLLDINERGTQPDYAESGLPVVNSKHVLSGEVCLNEDNRLAVASKDALTIQQGDVLMNGTGVGTIGRTAAYLHQAEALPDNHVTILRPIKDQIDPVYLAVFLNSLVGQLQVNKWLRGSSGQIELYPNDIAQFTVWLAPEDVQNKIRQSIHAAFAAKRRAAQLLDAAKRAVEIAIEDSEAAALAFLQATLDDGPP